MKFTVEGEAEGQLSASPVSNVGLGGTVGVTAKSSCCLLSALFDARSSGLLSHFDALRRDIVSVDLKKRRGTVQIESIIAAGNVALFSRQQRKIIVRP